MVENAGVVDGSELDYPGEVPGIRVLDSLMYMQSKDLIGCSVYFFGMAIVCLLCFLMVTVLGIQFAASGGIELIGIFVCVTFLALALGLFMRGLRSYRLGSAGLRHLARAGAV